MAKKGMRRYGPGDGMSKGKNYSEKNDLGFVPELQGKIKNSNKKIEETAE